MTKFNRETEIAGQFQARNARRAVAVFWSKGRRELMRMTRSFGASGVMARRNEFNSALQSRRRQACVISRGSLHVKRKVAGVISTQRRMAFSAGAA